jgi:protein FAM50
MDNKFVSSSAAEDVLKQQTVGLVHLSDFRKRRAEALDRRDSEGPNGGAGGASPQSGVAPKKKKKKKKPSAKAKLSFGVDEDDESGVSSAPVSQPKEASQVGSENEKNNPKKRLVANSGVAIAPKALTKTTLLRETQTQEQLRKIFEATREAVKATEIIIPYVFYDGTNVPGGSCRVKKGDHIWFFLDKARKVGAELGVGGDKSRRDWARVSVDDLMLVRDGLIIPHHYDFYYFLSNNILGFNGPIFDYSSQPTAATPVSVDEIATAETSAYDPFDRSTKASDKGPRFPAAELEGAQDDPTITKVVDRRWYERNKHIFPASVWEEYTPEKEFSKIRRKDAEGNAFFFT